MDQPADYRSGHDGRHSSARGGLDTLKGSDSSVSSFSSKTLPCPMVAVVIPVRNDAKRLRVCLESLRRSDYPASRVRVIVIDNGSSDASAQVAVEYGAELLKAPGLKVGAVRNRGVAVAEDAEIIAFVDSDHELPTDWLTHGVARLVERTDIVAAGAHYLAPPQGTWVQSTWALHRLRRRKLGEATWLGAGNLFIRRKDFQAVGGFDESLTASEDVDLCERLRQNRGVILLDPAIRSIHHGEPQTLVQFFKKELWRGKSGVRGFLAHGMPWHEWPSLAFPAWHFFFLIAMATSLIALAWNASPYWLLISVMGLFLPSVLLALKTAQQQRAWTHIPHLAILYFTYALARVASLFSW